MHNTGSVIVGVLIFLALVTFPIWYNAASETSDFKPELEKAIGEQCVRDTEYMVGNHMDLLNQWREEVVRGGDRFFVDASGTRREKSLSNTCLDCHVNKDKFCDQCHNYMGVTPYCWDCHVIPEEIK